MDDFVAVLHPDGTGFTLHMAESIEVTPAMIEAGLSVLADFNPEWSKPTETVMSLYLLMEQARCEHVRSKSLGA